MNQLRAVGRNAPRQEPDPRVGVRDARFDRIKIAIVPANFLASLLQMDGKFGLRFEGMPDGAQVLGVSTSQLPDKSAAVVFALHHPSFPVVPAGVMPPTLEVTYKKTVPGFAREGEWPVMVDWEPGEKTA